MGLHELWSAASRRSDTGPAAAYPSFAPRPWPLKPRGTVPAADPTDPQDEANPAQDTSASGGESSGTHGTGRGKNGRDSGTPSTRDVTVRRTEHHSDDESEPHIGDREGLEGRRAVRGLRSRRRKTPVAPPQPPAPDAPAPLPTASVHTAAGISRDDFGSGTARTVLPPHPGGRHPGA